MGGRSSEGNILKGGGGGRVDFTDASLNEKILNVVVNFSKWLSL